MFAVDEKYGLITVVTGFDPRNAIHPSRIATENIYLDAVEAVTASQLDQRPRKSLACEPQIGGCNVRIEHDRQLTHNRYAVVRFASDGGRNAFFSRHIRFFR